MKKKLVIGVIILTAIGVLITINAVRSKNIGAFSSGKAVEVRVVDTEVRDLDSTISVNGTLEEVNKQEVYFDSAVRVVKVLIKKDQLVRKGQKLVELDLSDLYSQLNQLKVNLRIQRINLDKLKSSLNLQNTTRAKSDVEQARIAKEQAEVNYQRLQQLYREGAVSQVELDNAKVQYDNAVIQFNTAQSVLRETEKNNSDLKINNAKDIETQVEQIKLAELKIDELEHRIEKLEKTSTANIDGVVSEINVEEGSITSPAVKAFRILSPDSLRVRLEVKEFDILKVKSGQTAEITGDAFPDKTIKGSVETVGAVAKKKEGVSSGEQAFVDVTVMVDNYEKILKPGLSVNATIITETKKDAVVIPFDTFQEDKDGNKWVFVVENGSARKKDIKTGISSGLDLEVTSGLTGNERLVKDPPSRLKDGMKVIVKDN